MQVYKNYNQPLKLELEKSNSLKVTAKYPEGYYKQLDFGQQNPTKIQQEQPTSS